MQISNSRSVTYSLLVCCSYCTISELQSNAKRTERDRKLSDEKQVMRQRPTGQL